MNASGQTVCDLPQLNSGDSTPKEKEMQPKTNQTSILPTQVTVTKTKTTVSPPNRVNTFMCAFACWRTFAKYVYNFVNSAWDFKLFKKVKIRLDV